MHVSIYSLSKTLFDAEAHSVNCKTAVGEITILENHEPLMSLLEAGPIKVTGKDEKEHYFPIRTGFLEVQAESKVRLVVEE